MKKTITLTIPKISEMAHQVNQEIFDGQLNLQVIVFEISKHKTFHAHLHMRQNKNLITKKSTYTPLAIKVSQLFVWTEEDLKNSIAHELIHLYEIQILKSKPAHGNAFFVELTRINDNFSGYNVQRKGNLERVAVSENEKAPVIFFISEDRTKLVFASKKNAMSILVSSSFKTSFENFSTGEIDAAKITRHKISRKYRYYYPVDEDKLKSLGI